MNMRKKLLGTVGAFALAMTMGAGIAGAEDAQTIGAPVQITVECASTNTGPSSASLVANGDVNFQEFDPSGEATSSRTGVKSLQVKMDVDQCQTDAWHVDASITDFTSENDDVIPGTQFQLTIGEETSSLTAYDDTGNPVEEVVASSASVVTFGTTGVPAERHSSNLAIASTEGDATGTMFMDFTGELINLTAETPAGTYEAEFTVTWTAGVP